MVAAVAGVEERAAAARLPLEEPVCGARRVGLGAPVRRVHLGHARRRQDPATPAEVRGSAAVQEAYLGGVA